MDKGKHKSQDHIAFHPGQRMFGIDFINDPLLQGRYFLARIRSLRLSGPIFTRSRSTALLRQLKTITCICPVQGKESLGDFVIVGNHRPLTFWEVNYGNKQSGSW